MFYLIFFVTANLTCEKFGCAQVPLDSTTCSYYQNGFHHLQPCDTDQDEYCPAYPPNPFNITCTKRPSPTQTSYIGGPCSDSISCSQGTCEQGRCAGKLIQQSCKNSQDCDIGLRCSRGTCKPLIKLGETGCSSDFDCQLKTGCNHTYGSRNGTCVQYYSLQKNSVISDCREDFSSFCQSGYCLRTGSFSQKGICLDPPVSVKNIPTVCSNNSMCLGFSGDQLVEGYCSCGYNSEGTAYCHPFQGDSPGVSYRSVLKKVLDGIDDGMCNTVRRWDYDCVAQVSSELAEEYREAELYYAYYPTLQGNDYCVQEVTNRFYYKGAIGVVVGGLAILVI